MFNQLSNFFEAPSILILPKWYVAKFKVLKTIYLYVFQKPITIPIRLKLNVVYNGGRKWRKNTNKNDWQQNNKFRQNEQRAKPSQQMMQATHLDKQPHHPSPQTHNSPQDYKQYTNEINQLKLQIQQLQYSLQQYENSSMLIDIPNIPVTTTSDQPQMVPPPSK